MFVCPDNPVEFVTANLRDLRNLMKHICSRYNMLSRVDDFTSTLIIELLHGRHRYNRNLVFSHDDGPAIAAKVKTYMYSVMDGFVLNRLKKANREEELASFDEPTHDPTGSLEERCTIDTVRRSLKKVVVGRATRNRLLTTLDLALSGCRQVEIAEHLGVSRVYVCMLVRALGGFTAGLLAGMNPEEAWAPVRARLCRGD
jgi:DNA-directed RNA polymerase specialized sigma24 family protein